MSHILSMFFAVVLSFGQSQTATVHHADAFIPPVAEMAVTATHTNMPAPRHAHTARHVLYNSYAGSGCSSCLMTNATLQPHLIWRAQR